MSIEWVRARVDVDPSGCWVWRLARNTKGYAFGRVVGKVRLIHRYTYQLARGPIPQGLQLDHLCRNRPCVNPDHLEPVTSRENTFRSPMTVARRNAEKTACKRGHDFDAENTRRDRIGRRCCRQCQRDRRHGVLAGAA